MSGLLGGTAQGLSNKNYIWDTSSLAWVAMQQPFIKTDSLSVTVAAQPGVDIGDVTINNGSGVNSVNIQDGGNTITVDGSVTVSGTVAISQTTPGTTNAVTIVDTSGNTLSLVKDQTNYNASNYGVMLMGVDDDTPQKLRYIRVEGVENDGETPLTSGAISSESYTMLLNSSNKWDRGRSITNGTDSTGLGIQAFGLVAQLDDTATSTVTENQFGNVRMSERRALLVEGVANSTAIKVDNSGVTQPISVSSLPLPLNASKETGGNLDSIADNIECIDDFNETFLGDMLQNVLIELKVIGQLLQVGLIGNPGDIKGLDLDKLRNEIFNEKTGGFLC